MNIAAPTACHFNSSDLFLGSDSGSLSSASNSPLYNPNNITPINTQIIPIIGSACSLIL